MGAMLAGDQAEAEAAATPADGLCMIGADGVDDQGATPVEVARGTRAEAASSAPAEVPANGMSNQADEATTDTPRKGFGQGSWQRRFE